jgi:hypothetical protein
MPHLPPAHHETSKRDSPNETKIKQKQNKTIPDSNLNLAKSMIHHNQIKELTTWFLNTVHCVRNILFTGYCSNQSATSILDQTAEREGKAEALFPSAFTP